MAHNIYIVDDDDLARESLSGLFSLQSDLVVREFSSGDLFLAEAEQLETGVIVLDFRMPGSNGVDVLKALRRMSDKKFAAILTTGEGDTRLAVQVMKLGAVDFIEKPYDVGELLGAVDVAFGHLAYSRSATENVENARAKIDALTGRERDVLAGLIEGLGNKDIADNLDISPKTVAAYRANLMLKLAVRNLPAVLRIAFIAGMVPLTA